MKEVVKLCVIYLCRVVSHIFWIFPICSNRIFFYSFAGKNYSCNPYYISKYLQDNFENKYEIIWAFQEPSQYKYLEEQGIKVVPWNGIYSMYLYMTSKVLVDNAGAHSYVKLRKSQLCINTWHGGGCYKKVSLGDQGIGKCEKRKLRLSYDNATIFLSSSKFFTNNVVRKNFEYQGKVLECGMPRNDHLICYHEHVQEREQVRQQLGLKEGQKMLLYAPTWRRDKDIDEYRVDFAALRKCLAERFGAEWVVAVRLHYELSDKRIGDDKTIDLSRYQDMQQLLLASDILLTDYSSSIWDYSFTGKPAILFAPDVDFYMEDRGFEKDIYTWGFPVCKDNDELMKAILQFDFEQFEENMKMHHKDLQSCESGYATKVVCEVIQEHCNLN